MLLPSWNEIGRKLIAMAEDFPEDKHDFKPTPAQRSFAEQLLHTAGSNDYFTDVANGRKPIGERLLDVGDDYGFRLEVFAGLVWTNFWEAAKFCVNTPTLTIPASQTAALFQN